MKEKIDNGQTKVSLDSYHRYWLSKNPGNWFDQGYTWPHPINSDSLRYYLPSMIISMEKIKDINWLFPLILLIKEVCNLIGWVAHPATTQFKSGSLRCHLLLMTIFIQKTKISVYSFPIYWWPRNLAIQLVQKYNWPCPTKSSSLRCCPHNQFHAKKVRYHLILITDIYHQRILKADWTKGTSGHTQQKSRC